MKPVLKQRCNRLALVACSLAVTSCSFWNPDPAERLAYRIERESEKLAASGNATAAFDFVPDPARAKQSPRFTDAVVIRVALDKPTGQEGDSTLSVSGWFSTTYHNRFVRTPKAMEATKNPGEPFRLVLRKSGEAILWTDLR